MEYEWGDGDQKLKKKKSYVAIYLPCINNIEQKGKTL